MGQHKVEWESFHFKPVPFPQRQKKTLLKKIKLHQLVVVAVVIVVFKGITVMFLERSWLGGGAKVRWHFGIEEKPDKVSLHEVKMPLEKNLWTIKTG